jgi:hypothetical protein
VSAIHIISKPFSIPTVAAIVSTTTTTTTTATTQKSTTLRTITLSACTQDYREVNADISLVSVKAFSPNNHILIDIILENLFSSFTWQAKE